jgi:hypothetical protein
MAEQILALLGSFSIGRLRWQIVARLMTPPWVIFSFPPEELHELRDRIKAVV